MNRRKFLTNTTAGALGFGAASSLAAPAIAQENPKLSWRITSAFPKSLDILYGTAEHIANYVREASGGNFDIQVFASGEIVPTGGIVDSVGTGTVQMGHTASYYYWGKNEAYALGTAVPFGLNVRQQNAWFWDGGGNELMNEFYANDNLYALPAGNTGAQMGGWYRNEINTLEDLQGLKLRIAGLAGRVIEKLGVVPQQIPAADIYPALERGTLDAVEFVGPYDDEKLGFVKVAPYYYYPAWWEGGAALHAMINLDAWNELPDNYKSLLTAACEAANGWMISAYDHRNPAALKRLAAAGAQLRPFSQEIMQASFEATKETHDEIAASNPAFKKIFDSQTAFKRDAYLWQQISEYTFDTFMMIQQRNGNL